MRVHLNGVVSDVHELWGGGPQGGLLTVILFNLYSNYITDLCQSGISQVERFIQQGRVLFPRCSNSQQRDCPPDLVNEAPHVCSHVVPCTARHGPMYSKVLLNPEAEI